MNSALVLFTVSELAEGLKVDERTIRREIDRKNLEAVRIGRRVRVTREALDAYLAKSKVA